MVRLPLGEEWGVGAGLAATSGTASRGQVTAAGRSAWTSVSATPLMSTDAGASRPRFLCPPPRRWAVPREGHCSTEATVCWGGCDLGARPARAAAPWSEQRCGVGGPQGLVRSQHRAGARTRASGHRRARSHRRAHTRAHSHAHRWTSRKLHELAPLTMGLGLGGISEEEVGWLHPVGVQGACGWCGPPPATAAPRGTSISSHSSAPQGGRGTH